MHPAFRNSARSVARLYDSLHSPGAAGSPADTGTSTGTQPFFTTTRSIADLLAGHDAIV